ncbi:PAS domain S-box protein [Brevundimonas sp. DWR2-3-1b1]|uniref:PAS domain S-box protein n=1 Tax=unclassified Brevundimonas TaxID=2622653 RepID=UPI003CE7665C
MAERVRRHDWASTPLGPSHAWPQSLRTAVALLIASPVPIVLLWGEHGVMIYNDAYSVFAGGRHPHLLGSNVREGWPEVADFNDNVMKVGLAGGTLAYKDQELTLSRHGRPEQVFMNLDYSPVPDESGRPAGVLAVVIETTGRVVAERQAAAEQARQRAMLRQMPGFAAVLTGPEHRFDYVNDAYVELAGQRQFLGRTVREVFPELDGQGFYELLDGVYRTGEAYRGEATAVQLAEGRGERFVDLLYEPVRDTSGAITGIFAGGYDVTEAVRSAAALADSESRYRTLFENVQTGFCIIHIKFDEGARAVDYLIVEGNAAFEDMTGLKDAAGKWVSEIAPGLEQHWFDLYGRVARTGEPARFENQAEVFGRWYDVEALRIGAPDAHRVAVLFNDISARKQLEARQAALIELDQALSHETDPHRVVQTSSRLLAKALRAYRAGYGEVDSEAETIVVADDWVQEGGESVAGPHSFRTYGTYIEQTLQGLPVAIADVTVDPRTAADPGALLAYQIRALLDVPVMENDRMVAQVLVHSDMPRSWTADDVHLARAFAERTRAVATRRKAQQEIHTAQRRQSVLLGLNDAVRDLTDPDEIAHASSRILAEALGVSRVGYGVMDTVAETVTIARDYNAPGVASIAGMIHFRDFGSYVEELVRGQTVVFADAANDPRVQDGGVALAGICATALINMPLIEQGEVVALLFVNNAAPRIWTDEDVALVREVAERVRTASERARVATSLRESERRLRFLDELARGTQPLTDADAILATTTRMTAEHLGVANCAYADMDEDEDGFTIRGDWAEPGARSIVGHYRLADFGQLAVQELGAGRPLIINDNLKEIAPEEASTFQALGISATICMPLVKEGRLTALMAIHAAQPHVWTDYELALIREVTERSWAHIERVRSLAEQRESEARYRTLFDTVDEGFCIIEFVDGPHGPLSDYLHVETNPAAAVQVGLSGVAGRTIRELAPNEAPDWVDLYKRVLDTGEPARVERAFEATDRWLEVAAFRIEPPTRNQVAVLFKDLTSRRTAETALRESEAQFRAFAQAVPNHVWASRPDGGLYWFNEQVYAYTGLSEGDIDGAEGWGKIVHPDDFAAAAETWGRALSSGERYSTEFRIRAADGRWRWFVVQAEPVRDEGGRIINWVGANSDIDDIRRQGEELEALNAQLEFLLEGSTAERDLLWDLSPDLLTVVNFEGRLERINPSWSRVLGWDEATLLSRPYAEILHPDEVEPIGDLLAAMKADGQPRLLEDRLRTATGEWRSFVWTLSPEPGGERLYGVGRDVTEDRAREQQLATAQEALRQSQKMEAVGQLTGGIAHDFNNLLAGISGALELLSKRLSEGRLNGMERYIDAAQDSAKRAASLTQRLLAFSRRQTLDPKPTDVNRLINGMEDLIRRTVGPAVEVEVVGAGGLWATKIDQSQLENALLNLCINARDAMAPGGGRLTIETSNKWLDDRAAKARELAPGQYVSLCVTDTGTGMPPEVQAQAFDPFFTTKPLGQGTGLGLSMIHGFVRQSGGQVRIYSEIGQGTTMCLYLPRHQGGVEEGDEVSGTPVTEGGHGETVLIIDDEATVRMLVAEVLGEAGYSVIEAPDGPSGLDILRSSRRIDLLISDVGLPGGMNGRQVADAARVDRPELKVLFITGYAENAAVGNGLLAPGMEVLTKPFVMGDLAAKVHDMIER